MKKIFLIAGIAVTLIGTGFIYVLYKIGEEMHAYRCGCERRNV